MPNIEHKSIHLKALNDGSLEAVISTFNQKDRDGDIMLASAFSRSAGKSIPMVWAHNWADPIGKGSVLVNQDEAVFAGEFFMDTQRGQEAYKTVKNMGDLQEYSIGFRILDSADEKSAEGWVRTIKDIELFEASPVLVGAALGTRTLAVKSMGIDDLHDELKHLTASHLKLCTDDRCEFGTKHAQHRVKAAHQFAELQALLNEARED